MKTATEIFTEVHEVALNQPKLYEGLRPREDVFVAAIVELDQRLKEFQRLHPATADPNQEPVPARLLTVGAMQKQLYTCLTRAGDQERDIALKIYRFIQSL